MFFTGAEHQDSDSDIDGVFVGLATGDSNDLLYVITVDLSLKG